MAMINFNFHGINFEVSENSLTGKVAKAFTQVDEYVNAVKSGVEYEALPRFDYNVIYDLVDETWNSELHEVVWDKYNEYNYYHSIAYKKYAEGDFLKYFLNGVPSIEECNDACLSDWHKDIYGYRPRGSRWDELVGIAREYFSRVE